MKEVDFVISYPKSGRTWLRVVLDKMGVDLVYDHGNSHFRHNHSLKQIKIEEKKFTGKNIIFLIRDPRDVVVSSYFHITRRHLLFEGSISESIRHPQYGIERIMKFLSAWTDFLLSSAVVDFHIIKYEDMHIDTYREISEILYFLEVFRKEKEIIKAIQFGSFPNMKKMERKGTLREKYRMALTPRKADDNESYKVRKGVVGGYRDYMEEKDISYCQKIMSGYPLKKFGNLTWNCI